MERDRIYAGIEKNKLWMVLAAANHSASVAPTSLDAIHELCRDTIGALTLLKKEIEDYKKGNQSLRILTGKPIKAKVGNPVKI
jgi:hypothetical protein